MNDLPDHSHSPTNRQVCYCATCRSLNNARLDLSAVRVQEMARSTIEHKAADLVVHAERMLATASNILQHHHVFGSLSAQLSPERVEKVVGPRRATNDVLMNRSLLISGRDRGSPNASVETNPPSPTRPPRKAEHIDGRSGRVSAPKRDDFEISLRYRAAELGILRSTAKLPPLPVTPSPLASMTVRAQADQDPAKSKFIVCDHCRSHGIRCNEASVCKECMYREVCCTHHRCDMSPASREDCPRTICFYVHEDWMPDMYGQHNPDDENWIVLPGKVREHLSAGQLTKSSAKSEEETRRYHAGVLQRQSNAKKEIRALVESGKATWEGINMLCRCKQYEHEEDRTKALEMQLRRLEINRIDRQSSI